MICIPIRTKKTTQLLVNLKKAQEIGDLIEVWFEELTDLTPENLEKIFAAKKKPFVLKYQGSLEILHQLSAFPIEYIDLDVQTSPKIIAEVHRLYKKTQVILSHHDFEKTPDDDDLKALFRKIKQKGADIKKIAVTAKSFSDSLRLLSVLKELSAQDEKLIFVAMGQQGKITRTAGHLCGNYLMYCPLSSANKTAPGQVTAAELQSIMKLTSQNVT